VSHNTSLNLNRHVGAARFRSLQVSSTFSRLQAADGVPTGLKRPWLLDVGWRDIEERSADQSPRLAVRSSRLRQPNAQLESMGLQPAIQPLTLLGHIRIGYDFANENRRICLHHLSSHGSGAFPRLL